MQLGMIGLGRMGANIVRRLMRNDHACFVYDRDPAPGKTLAGEGASAVGSLSELVSSLDAPRAIAVLWCILADASLQVGERATLIAENEMMNAQTAGTVAVWSNLDTTTIVRWRVNDLAPRVEDECDDYEDQGDVPLGHEFAPGLFFPRSHPRCRCRLEVISTPKL